MIRSVPPILSLALLLAACGAPAEKAEAPAAPAAQTPASAPPAGPAKVIPATFLGHWDHDGGACGKSDRENPLFLETSRLTFYESGGDVTAVRSRDADTVDVDAAMSGEGQEWNATLTFALSEGGATLTTTQAGLEPSVRHRCQPEGQA